MKPAGEFLDQILSEAPSSETLFLLLKRWKAGGEVNNVIRECIKGLCRFPRDIRIRGLLAEVCFESGWLWRAESEVETATAQIEDLVPLYKLKAQIYTILNRREEAAKCLKIYLVHRPDDKESLALMQALTSRPEAPPDAYQPPPGSSPEIATPTLAEVYFAQGQLHEAISTYEKFLAQNPEAEQSRKRLKELRAMIAPPPPVQEDADAERERKKKMKMIHVLEIWKESMTVSSKQ
jgi:tetratricopeptide (TPR) repeat protein